MYQICEHGKQDGEPCEECRKIVEAELSARPSGCRWSDWPTDKLKLEIRDRLLHFYGQIDGTFLFPNSNEGDLLKIVSELVKR